MSRPLRLACTLSLALASLDAAAQQPEDSATPAKTLDAVVVVAGLQRVPAFDAPVSTSTIDLEQPQRAASRLAATLAPVPGLLARGRQNLAQDM